MYIENSAALQATHGYRFYETDEQGYTVFYRFSHEIIENHLKLTKDFYERCFDTTGTVMKFRTDSSEFSFDYRLDWINGHDSIEVFVNGSMTVHFPVWSDNAEGKFSCRLIPESAESTGESKRAVNEVWVYFPNYARLSAKDFAIDEGCIFQPVDTSACLKVLILGDSITQGSGIGWSGLTYANTVSRLLNWEAVNLSIGGYSFYPEGLEEQPFRPEFILVSLGTNSCRSASFEDRTRAYFDKLTQMYPDVPVMAISPVYRQTLNVEFVHDIIRRCTENHPNITLVNGYSFIPHITEFYRDGVHPTLTGSGFLASAVIAAVNKYLNK